MSAANQKKIFISFPLVQVISLNHQVNSKVGSQAATISARQCLSLTLFFRDILLYMNLQGIFVEVFIACSVFMALLSRLVLVTWVFCDWHLHNLYTMSHLEVLCFQSSSYHKDKMY